MKGGAASAALFGVHFPRIAAVRWSATIEWPGERLARGPALNVSQDALQQHCAVAAYTLAENFFVSQRLACESLGLDPVRFAIYATILCGNFQRAVREAPSYGSEVLPKLIPISRLAIAAATGLPRETVRRKVKQLVDEGYVEAMRGGVVAVLNPEALSAFQQNTEEAANSFARSGNLLLRYGVITR